jgi:hypothetical protein
MTINAWEKLTMILSPLLKRKNRMSRSVKPIFVSLIMACGMRWLTGGQATDQKHIFGLSRTEVYRCVNGFIMAVTSAPELQIRMPNSVDKWRDINLGYKQKSRYELLKGCVGAIDGYFQKTNAPGKKEVANVLAYYSGHYESYGFNCQAACDASLRFMYFGVIAPGSTNDNIAFPLSDGLVQAIRVLPRGLYMVGDAAYTLSEQLLIPFTGSQRSNVNNDSFNYHLSQLRIRIEMAFGRLVNKFRVLKRNLEGRAKKNSRVIMACAILHNFIIDHDRPQDIFRSANESAEEPVDVDDLDIVAMPGAPMGMCYLPTMPEDDFEDIVGVSHTRSAIVQAITTQYIRRPQHNIMRNRDKATIEDLERAFYHPN